MNRYINILFFIFCLGNGLIAQNKSDTLRFTLHCLENEVFTEENLLDQLDSVLGKHGFNDIDYATHIEQAIIFGHTDNKGSKKSNQILSEKRADYVFHRLGAHYSNVRHVVIGFGETRPIADNETEEGRDKNRRVEVTLVYSQEKIVRPTVAAKTIYRDTIIVFEDGTLLKINLYDYNLIKDCLKYERKSSLYDLFEDLTANEDDATYYNFGKVSIKWCNTKCLSNKITLSVKVPDTLIKAYLKEIKQYVKQLKNQQAKLQKHKDNMWYIDAVTYCPFEWVNCGFRCGTRGGGKQKLKKVRFVTKDNYRIVAASYSYGQMYKFKRIKSPKRKIKFKTTCPGSLPYVSVIAVRKNSLDTIYYASGTESSIAYKKRCINCVDKEIVVRKIIGIKIHKRLLRRKYIFKEKNFEVKIRRKE